MLPAAEFVSVARSFSRANKQNLVITQPASALLFKLCTMIKDDDFQFWAFCFPHVSVVPDCINWTRWDAALSDWLLQLVMSLQHYNSCLLPGSSHKQTNSLANSNNNQLITSWGQDKLLVKAYATSRWLHWQVCVWIPLNWDHMGSSLSPDSRKWKCYCSHNTGHISETVFSCTVQSVFSFYSQKKEGQRKSRTLDDATQGKFEDLETVNVPFFFHSQHDSRND